MSPILDFDIFHFSRNPRIHGLLGTGTTEGNLEKVEENVLLEQSTVAAILAETELRLQPKDTMILKPSVTTPWANDEVVEDLGGEVATTKVSIQTTKHVFFVLWSEPPRHYTYLYVRNIEGEPRHIEFKD